MPEPKAPNSDQSDDLDDIFADRSLSLTSEEDGMNYIRQLAGETAGDEGSDSDSDESPGVESLWDDDSGELTEDALLTALPEDKREGAQRFLASLRKPAAQDSGGDLDDLLKMVQEEPDDDEDDTMYGAAVPDDLKPFIEDFTNEFAGTLRGLKREVSSLKTELQKERAKNQATSVRQELKDIEAALGSKAYKQIAPKALQLMQAVPELADSEQGLRLAFENAALRQQLGTKQIDQRAAARGGAVRRQRSAVVQEEGLEGPPENIEQAARVAARRILQSGEMSKRELQDLLG